MKTVFYFSWMVLFGLASSSVSLATSPQRFETFRLYDKADVIPSPGCDVGTNLVIDYFEDKATLEKTAEGICMLIVDANNRIYQLDRPFQKRRDGSFYLSGTLLNGAPGFESILITDARQSSIPSVQKHRITVYETTDNGEKVLFSPLMIREEIRFPDISGAYCSQMGGKVVDLAFATENPHSVGVVNFCQLDDALIGKDTFFQSRKSIVGKTKVPLASKLFLKHPLRELPTCVNPVPLYCNALGGEAMVFTEPNDENKPVPVCRFKDGSQIGGRTLFLGPKDTGNKKLAAALRKALRGDL